MTPRAKICLVPDFANLVALEGFIRDCAFLGPDEKNRSLLVATEYFDNIVRYAHCLAGERVSVTVRKKASSVTICVSYRARGLFEAFRADGEATPHYDAAVGRYRGLGLRMCRNLASAIRYKKGLLKRSIVIIL